MSSAASVTPPPRSSMQHEQANENEKQQNETQNIPALIGNSAELEK